MADKFDAVRTVQSMDGDNLLAEAVWNRLLCHGISNQMVIPFRPGTLLTSCPSLLLSSFLLKQI
jgi:hypothetical protein